ncbi:MAG: carboxypeptidase regulatory-like domain-containing protein [Myxococcales bacterium]|nr:carboxypeptidase regulatory-like domain-containing protein [Myxococcales bacterium]
MRKPSTVSGILWVYAALSLAGCKEEEPPPPGQQELPPGEACDPTVERVPDSEQGTGGESYPPVCAPGLACEPVDGSSGDYVCGAAVELRGLVTDSTTGTPIAGALVAALNESGEPVTDVATTDACGAYVLPVSVRRTPDGQFAETPKWTLNVSAQDYLPFPAGLRPALPIDIVDAVPDPDPPEADSDGEDHIIEIIDNAATSVALVPLPADEAGGAVVTGTVAGEGVAGMLVVAEGGAGRTPYGIVDASGHYTLFNVSDGEKTIRGYRRGVEVDPIVVMATGGAVEGADLPVVGTDPAAMATVDGSLNIVNAPGGSQTSVVLVPTSVYNELLERGPVPVGLRVPDPPLAPDVTGSFAFDGVPAGTYKVLVAFENDDLVRDPDEGIAGTDIQEITVAAGQPVSLEEGFKVTEALEVSGPGASAPERVDAQPTLVFADDSSEDGYIIHVYNALGDLVWETEIEGVSGSARVEVPYGGPALEPGMYYQFRATSFREPPNGDRTFISRTEDLRGVFVTGEPEPADVCESEETDGGGADGTTGG